METSLRSGERSVVDHLLGADVLPTQPPPKLIRASTEARGAYRSLPVIGGFDRNNEAKMAVWS
jgi:hypothetical protein